MGNARVRGCFLAFAVIFSGYVGGMKMVCYLLPVVLLSACDVGMEKSDGVGAAEEKPRVKEEVPDFDVMKSETLVGKRLEDVEPALEAAEVMFRVVERDGEMFPVTRDYRPDRLNFKIKEGVIVEVTKG